MFCNKCGNEISEGEKFCRKCGAEAVDTNKETINNNYNSSNENNKKPKIKIDNVINSNDLVHTRNETAYTAKAWALQVKNRGQNLGILALVIYIIIGFVVTGNATYLDTTPYWLLYTVYGIVTMIVIIAIFNTIAFIIRMGAEVIQLLDDIKNKRS